MELSELYASLPPEIIEPPYEGTNMTFGQLSNTDITRLTTYAEALAFEQSVIPIRGRLPEVKPLGRRDRVDEFKIRAGNGRVECIYHRTAVVVFEENGTIIINNDEFNSKSTLYFIGSVLGVYGRIFDSKIRLTVKDKEYSIPEGGLKLDRDFNVINPMQEFVHKLSRKNLTKVRKQYAPFLKYADNTLRLLGNQFTKEHFTGAYTSPYLELSGLYAPHLATFVELVEMIFELINDDSEAKHESHWRALLAIAWGIRKNSIEVNPKQFKEAFTDLIIGIHRDEVLTAVPLEIGTVAKDRYAKYYNSTWDNYTRNS
jgi:hypothetical protein